MRADSKKKCLIIIFIGIKSEVLQSNWIAVSIAQRLDLSDAMEFFLNKKMNFRTKYTANSCQFISNLLDLFFKSNVWLFWLINCFYSNCFHLFGLSFHYYLITNSMPAVCCPADKFLSLFLGIFRSRRFAISSKSQNIDARYCLIHSKADLH